MKAQYIEIPERFRDRWFAKRGGASIQARFDDRPEVVEHDFSKCIWIDPIPILGLLCHVFQWAKLTPTSHLVVQLGGARTDSGLVDSPARPRLFLAKHGFLRALTRTCKSIEFHYESGLSGYPTVFPESSVYDLETAIELSTSCNLFYEMDAACPPLFCESGIDPSRDVTPFVDDVLQTMDARLFRARQSEFRHRDSALVRARQVVTEIVVNACEHAYRVGETGPIVLYARRRQLHDYLRQGAQRAIEHDKRGTVEREILESAVDSPLISVMQEAGTKYLEIFICDIGRGLTADGPAWQRNSPDEETKKELDDILASAQGSNPLRARRRMLSLIFRKPVSRHGRSGGLTEDTRSNITGLFHVNTVLSQHTDRSRIYVAPEWTASEHPRPENYNGGPQDIHFETVPSDSGESIRGSYFHFAIDISQEPDLAEPWFVPSASNTDNHTLRTAFHGHTTLHERETRVFDLRTLLGGTGGPSPMSQRNLYREFVKYVEECGSTAIVRMSRDFRKNVTDQLLQRWVRHSVASFNPDRLVFCDLSQAQAVLLAAHLEKVSLDKDIVNNVASKALKITVLSEDIVACGLTLTVVETTHQLRFRLDTKAPAIDLLATILKILRWHDSNAFWTRVANSTNRLLLPDVVWDDGNGSTRIELPLYLDYSLAVQDREIAKIIRRALRRALATFRGLVAVAIDDLIKPDLEDALRWRSRGTDGHSEPKELFVISSVVTGSTINQAERQRGREARGILACFVVAAVPDQTLSRNVFSALEWIPPKMSSHGAGKGNRWERVPGTPFVRPFIERDGHRVPLVRPVARQIVDRGGNANLRPSVAESYREWHRERLLRIGHWSIDRRHGLIEVDHARALQVSAESRHGFYRWVGNELETRSKDISKPLLVYPPGRLNGIMVRHLIKTGAIDARRWQILPVNYLPDVGDGLKQVSPLSLEQISQFFATETCGAAFFLDIGFVGNRTFRHTKRQLVNVGLKSVIGLGLMNRTSYPALPKEMHAEAEDVICYWRFDVPTLDDERSCPICKSKDSLSALRERATVFQPALVACIDKIRADWQLTDPSLAWWDHGLEPLVFDTALKKRFGFTPPALPEVVPPPVDAAGQTSLLGSLGEPIQPKAGPKDAWPSDEVEWGQVWIQNSTQAVAYAVEIARTQANPDYPIKFAKELAETREGSALSDMGCAAAIEIIACFFLLCASDLTVTTKERGTRLLIRYLIHLEGNRQFDMRTELKGRMRSLRQLTVLALTNLDDETKFLVRNDVVWALCQARLVNQETQVGLMTVALEEYAPDDSRTADIEKLIDTKLSELKAHTESSEELSFRDQRSLLSWNRQLITLTKRSVADQFKYALRFFGPSDQHGECVEVLQRAAALRDENVKRSISFKEEEDPSAGWSLVNGTVQMAHSIICQGWRNQAGDKEIAGGVGEMFSALCSLDNRVVTQLFDYASRAVNPDKRNADARKARSIIDTCRRAFHSAMIRVEPNSPAEGIARIRGEIEGFVEELTESSVRQDTYRVVDQTGSFKVRHGMRYVLFGLELRELIKRLCREAARYAPDTSVSAPQELAALDGLKARIWIFLEGDSAGRLAISIWNIGIPGASESEFEQTKVDMAPVHQQIGTTLLRIPPSMRGGKWFQTKIELHWLPGGTQ